MSPSCESLVWIFRISLSRALIQEDVSQRTHSEAITSGGTPTNSQSSQTRSTSAGGSQVRKDKPQVQDDRMASIDMGRFKGAKNIYNVIRDGLRAGLKVNKVTETLTIKSLRPGPGDRIDVVFANKDETSRAKQHTPWRTSSLAGARVKGERWYPVKSDSVVKHSVLDRDSWSKSQMH